MLENYVKTIAIEAEITIQMANRQILPAARFIQCRLGLRWGLAGPFGAW